MKTNWVCAPHSSNFVLMSLVMITDRINWTPLILILKIMIMITVILIPVDITVALEFQTAQEPIRVREVSLPYSNSQLFHERTLDMSVL